jgi:hypothetical protein
LITSTRGAAIILLGDHLLKAERLRGEYFLFLARVPPYDVDDDEERARRLHERVGAIQAEEPA